MWLINNASIPDDYIIGSGKLHSVEDLIKIVFNYLDLDWKKFVRIDNKFKRYDEKTNLLANINKIKQKLNWEPKINFEDMLIKMIDDQIKYSEDIQNKNKDI